MNDRAPDIAEIIDLLGGPGAIAEAVRAETGENFVAHSVHWWKYRETIPANRWPTLLRLAKQRGVNKLVTQRALERHWKPRSGRKDSKVRAEAEQAA